VATFITWNVKWATPHSRRASHLLDRIDRHEPDVICLTETHHNLHKRPGYTICSQPDYGYPVRHGHRKVLLWSRARWRGVDVLGVDTLPPGRFVSGVTATPLGDVTVVGVCIPWFGSRTEAWRGDARMRRWEDHERYLDGLRQVLERIPQERAIVIGDFNQIIGPASSAPTRLRSALPGALPPGMRIVTADIDFGGRSNIDHIALTADLAATTTPLSNLREGKELSDHFGVMAHVSKADTGTPRVSDL